MRLLVRRIGQLALILCTAVLATPLAQAQQTASATAGADPSSIAVAGEVVRFWIEIIVPDSELPVTITSLTSSLHGDLSDSANAALETFCPLPADYSTPTPGWVGWVCQYEAFTSGSPGGLDNDITATVEFGNGSELVITATATVTIDEQLGTITGVLVDSATGAPIPDIFVYGTCEGCGGFTDASGRFNFVGVEPGTYQLRSGSAPSGGWDPAPPSGYTTTYAFEWYDEEPSGPAGIENPTAVDVLSGGTTDIVWELSSGGEVTGTLTDFAGNPVTEALVAYWLTEPDGSYSPVEAGGYVEIGAGGAYRIFGLRSGAYLICFDTVWPLECWDDVAIAGFPPGAGTPVTVALGQTTADIDAILGSGSDEPTGESPTLPFTGFDELAGWLAATLLLAGVTVTVLARSSRSASDRR